MLSSAFSTSHTHPIHLDPLGRLSKLILANGSTYTRSYDDFGRIIHAHDANTGQAHINHNHDDMPTHITHALGYTELNYTSLGQMSQIVQCLDTANTAQNTQSNTNQATNCQHTSLSYDDKARLSHITHPNQNQTLSYDAKGMLTTDSITLTHQTNTYTTQYSYDDKGRVTYTHLPEGLTLSHHYDAHSQLTSLGYEHKPKSLWQTLTHWINKNQDKSLLSNIKASPIKGLIHLTHANQSKQSLSYDDKDRLLSKQDGSISTALDYDKQGNLNTISTDDVTTDIQDISLAYTYDPNHNRTQSQQQNQTKHYTYQPNSDRLSTITTKDEQGNTVQTIQYVYDELGNPITITTYDNQGNTTMIRTLDYHPDGQIKSIKDTPKIKLVPTGVLKGV